MVTFAFSSHPEVLVVVDDIDADLAELTWHLHAARRGHTPYAARSEGRHNNHKTAYLHRVIMEKILGRALRPWETVDHSNRDSLDNRRGNLRVATRAQNAANKRGQGRSSQYRGVTLNKRLWRAEVWCSRKRVFDQQFETEVEAALAYNAAAREHYGEFAYQNRIGGAA